MEKQKKFLKKFKAMEVMFCGWILVHKIRGPNGIVEENRFYIPEPDPQLKVVLDLNKYHEKIWYDFVFNMELCMTVLDLEEFIHS